MKSSGTWMNDGSSLNWTKVGLKCFRRVRLLRTCCRGLNWTKVGLKSIKVDLVDHPLLEV